MRQFMDGYISETKELTSRNFCFLFCFVLFCFVLFFDGRGVVGQGMRAQIWHVSVKHPVVTSSLPGLRFLLLLSFFASTTEPLKG